MLSPCIVEPGRVFCRAVARRDDRSWLTRTVREFVDAMKRPDPLGFSRHDIERLCAAWEQAARRLRKARTEGQEIVAIRPLVCNVLRPLVGGSRRSTLAWVLTPEGTLSVGARTPGAFAARAAVELVDFARKRKPAWRVFLRVRRCATCGRFFDDEALRAARHPNAYHSDECRRAARAKQRGAPDALAKSAERVRRLRKLRAGMDARPGRCRAPDLLKRQGHNARMKILRDRYRLSEARAHAVLDREVACVERRVGV